jgi:hypothetical protein
MKPVVGQVYLFLIFCPISASRGFNSLSPIFLGCIPSSWVCSSSLIHCFQFSAFADELPQVCHALWCGRITRTPARANIQSECGNGTIQKKSWKSKRANQKEILQSEGRGHARKQTIQSKENTHIQKSLFQSKENRPLSERKGTDPIEALSFIRAR